MTQTGIKPLPTLSNLFQHGSRSATLNLAKSFLPSGQQVWATKKVLGFKTFYRKSPGKEEVWISLSSEAFHGRTRVNGCCSSKGWDPKLQPSSCSSPWGTRRFQWILTFSGLRVVLGSDLINLQLNILICSWSSFSVQKFMGWLI